MKRNETTSTRRDFVAQLGGVAVGLAATGFSAGPALAGGSQGNSDRVGASVAHGLVRPVARSRPQRRRVQPAGRGARLCLCRADPLRGSRSRGCPAIARCGGCSATSTGSRSPAARKGYAWDAVANAALASILRSLIPTAGPGGAPCSRSPGGAFRAQVPPSRLAARPRPVGAARPQGGRRRLRMVGGRRRPSRDTSATSRRYSPPAGPGSVGPDAAELPHGTAALLGRQPVLRDSQRRRAARPETTLRTRRQAALRSDGRRGRSTTPSTR